MKIAHGLLLACLLAGPASVPCAASRLALHIEPSSSFRPGMTTVSVKLTNMGDEPARRVWIEAGIGGNTVRSTPVESLDVNETMTAGLSLDMTPPDPGIYTIIIKAHCTDANGHPFSALKSIPLVTGDRAPHEADFSPRLSTVRMRRSGELVLSISAPPDAGIQGTATLVLPDALRCDTTVRNVDLAAGAATNLQFQVDRLFARPGSRYLALAVVDYSFEGAHRSVTAQGSVLVEPPAQPFGPQHRRAWIVVLTVLLVLFAAAQFIPRTARLPAVLERAGPVVSIMLLLAILCFLLHNLAPALLVTDSVTVGGDTPAHNYMASHLKSQLLGHGRIVSWSNGWWCGFPMFQFYFPLPYIAMALLGCVMPLTIALKLVSVAGIFCLPLAAWAVGRMLRLPKPTPLLLAIAVLPVLFDPSNTMWGVNIYSTLAGMIANSISFPLMLLFLASAARDAGDGQFRFRTAFLLAAVAASHFFTLIVACLTATIIPFLHGRRKILSASLVLAGECALGLLLMCWWFVPLLAKQQYSMDFGVNWPVEKLPGLMQGLLPLAVAAAAFAVTTAAVARKSVFAGIISHMLLVSSLLLLYGYDHVARVFQNIRFWPFIAYSIFALAAFVVGTLCHKARAHGPAAAAILVLALVFGTDQPNHVRSWAEWNYEGLEAKARRPVFSDLLIPKLTNTPGRLANDLHPDNASLGSSRIFECIPFLINKPILEGGIVNSAAGSMFSYYIQGETSENTAGFPNIVQPAAFNFTNATRHLALFNVKHFIARWTGARRALAESPDWRLLGECQDWELYELTSHDGKYVFVPTNAPIAVRLQPRETPGDDWKLAGLEWMYNINSIDQPYILLGSGRTPPAGIGAPISEQQFLERVRGAGNDGAPAPSPTPAGPAARGVTITDEVVTDDSISFRTSGLGLPHIIKCNYYPNWKARGAQCVYMVTPCFMLVYPDSPEVELYYGYTFSDNIGRALSCLGILIAVAASLTRLVRMRDKAAGGHNQRRPAASAGDK